MNEIEQLKEVLGDNKEALELLGVVSNQVSKLSEANETLVKDLEYEKGERQAAVNKRGELNARLKDLEAQLETAGSDPEYEKLKESYTKEKEALEQQLGELKTTIRERTRDDEFNNLNILSKFPSGLSDEQIAMNQRAIKIDLMDGYEFNEESGGFSFKDINPETAKPYTLKERFDSRLKSGMYDSFIVQTDKGGSGTPPSGDTPKIENTDFEKGDSHKMMDEAFKKTA